VDFRFNGVKSHSWCQNQITVRVSKVRIRARVSVKVRFRLIILVGQCQIWLLLH